LFSLNVANSFGLTCLFGAAGMVYVANNIEMIEITKLSIVEDVSFLKPWIYVS
jgi:hypothetical protein